MNKKKPCGLDYCPQEELIGVYASCTACAWGEQNEEMDKPQVENNRVKNEKKKKD